MGDTMLSSTTLHRQAVGCAALLMLVSLISVRADAATLSVTVGDPDVPPKSGMMVSRIEVQRMLTEDVMSLMRDQNKWAVLNAGQPLYGELGKSYEKRVRVSATSDLPGATAGQLNGAPLLQMWAVDAERYCLVVDVDELPCFQLDEDEQRVSSYAVISKSKEAVLETHTVDIAVAGVEEVESTYSNALLIIPSVEKDTLELMLVRVSTGAGSGQGKDAQPPSRAVLLQKFDVPVNKLPAEAEVMGAHVYVAQAQTGGFVYRVTSPFSTWLERGPHGIGVTMDTHGEFHFDEHK